MQRMYFQCDPSEDLEAWSADRIWAELLELAVRKDDAEVLDGYTDRALARVWKSQHFSYWMTTMLHTLAGGTGFDARRQLGELSSAVESRAGSANLAEAYCGWPEARA